MILTWGMSDTLGLISYEANSGQADMMYMMPGEKKYSENTAEQIDREIKKVADEAYSKAKKLIEKNKNELEQVAKALLKYETLDAEDVQLILDGGTLDKPTVADLLAVEQNKKEKPKPEKKNQQDQQKPSDNQ